MPAIMEQHRYNISSAWIIHGFALLHAGLTVACRIAGVDDSMMLTMMTMLMTVLLCLRQGLSMELTAAGIILVNVFGLLSGIGLASLFGQFLDSPLLVHSISTLLTTEILGWSVLTLSGLWKSGENEQSMPGWPGKMKWFALACLAVLLARLLYQKLLAQFYPSSDAMFSVIIKFISNAPVLFILVCLNIIYVRFARRSLKKRSFTVKIVLFSAFLAVVSCMTALFVGVGLPFAGVKTLTLKEYLLMCFPSAVVEITVYFIIYLLDYAFSAREEMLEQREKAQKAEFQYFRLKQQVNPHFLFNSLNILDGIVCGDNPEQASGYIHKLAAIYRYMLKNDSSDTVLLKDELVFVGLYTDLLKIRFPDGFNVNVDVKEEDMMRHVVPCAVQLLVENAVKHNAVGADTGLTVTIASDGENLTVSNNICRKISAVSSTGVGQKYIKAEYLRRSGKTVTAVDTGEEYIFNLPLL